LAKCTTQGRRDLRVDYGVSHVVDASCRVATRRYTCGSPVRMTLVWPDCRIAVTPGATVHKTGCVTHGILQFQAKSTDHYVQLGAECDVPQVPCSFLETSITLGIQSFL
jgi:hypothetical protein